jgi:MoaA/NifB/PqqE/SkfB family radical SAM enzyme
MAKIENIVNSWAVKKLFTYYGGRGSKRIDELFGKEKEKTPGALVGRIPIQIILNKLTDRIGLNADMKERFFSKYYNRQTFMNIIKTLGENGLKQPFRFSAPLVVVWNYTNRCNLRCRYCYQSAGKRLDDELRFEEKIDLINQMRDAHVAFLALSGGEPILGERFWDILNYTSKYLHVSIASNGTLLGDKLFVQRLAENGARNVFVSLDGATAESHDFIRGNGSFRKSLKGIQNCVANPWLKVGINMVVTQRNYNEVQQVLDLARELGVNSFNHYNFIPTGRGKEDFANDLTSEQRENLLNLLADNHFRRKETGLNIISTAPQYARVIYARSGQKSSGVFHYTADNATSITGIIEYAGGCGAGRVYAAVQPNGIMTPCVFMPGVPIGNLRERRFIDIWQNSETCMQMVDRENYHYQCPKYRNICGGCRARAYAYGDLIGPDPRCKIYQDTMHTRIHKDEPEEQAVDLKAALG